MPAMIVVVVLVILVLVLIPVVPQLFEVRIRILDWLGLKRLAAFHRRHFNTLVKLARIGILVVLAVVLVLLMTAR